MADLTIIENKIGDVLTGETQRGALDFVAFLRANDISPECHESGDGWSVMYAGESIGFILVNGAQEMPGPWTVWFNSCEFGEDCAADDAVKQTAWEHASICGHFETGGKVCGCGDQPGFTRTIFGKVFENRCHSPLMFTNPDTGTLVSVEKLMLMLKQSVKSA